MASKVLLSPTEHSLAGLLKGEAITSSVPEEKGADILIYSKHGLFGIQRKEVPHDFISSIGDGRLSRETSLLRDECAFKLLLCEGHFKYYPDTTLVTDKNVKSKYIRKQIRGMLLDISLVKGIPIDYTDDIYDTAEYIRSVISFVDQDKHLGLFTRPNVKGAWYVPTAKEIHLWVLQSFSGVGPVIADRIMENFNGEIPLAWTCTEEELSSVPRLSKERAKQMHASLPSTRPAEHDNTRRTDKLARVRALIRKDK